MSSDDDDGSGTGTWRLFTRITICSAQPQPRVLARHDHERKKWKENGWHRQAGRQSSPTTIEPQPAGRPDANHWSEFLGLLSVSPELLTASHVACGPEPTAGLPARASPSAASTTMVCVRLRSATFSFFPPRAHMHDPRQAGRKRCVDGDPPPPKSTGASATASQLQASLASSSAVSR